jgi:hypothetical protein
MARTTRKITHIAARKLTMLERLTAGEAVGQSARAAGVSRAVAYTWKNEDSEFSAAWDDAVDEGIDMLETIAYRRAIEGSDGLLSMYLRNARSIGCASLAVDLIFFRCRHSPSPSNEVRLFTLVATVPWPAMTVYTKRSRPKGVSDCCLI